MRSLREAVRQGYAFRCGYCGVHEHVVGAELEIDHFRPRMAGGSDDLSNLVYCCTACNRLKGGFWPTDTASKEPARRLLHPQHDDFAAHIRKDTDGRLIGVTGVGRFHVERLQLNRPALLARRQERQRMADLQLAVEGIQADIAELTRRITQIERDVRRSLGQIDRFINP